ncbi:MAG: cytidylate kinase-like family protein [Elusimicrobia bacterium]|nr:cytidylate kinase-like family protein [Elusimicrobiota bacterium]
MRIICVSRGSHSRGKEFAECLAKKLGFGCLGREDLVEEAVKAGVAVSKLEMAVVKQAVFSERLAREKEQYQALLTSSLCARALREDLVYHGWTGHLLLRGVSHVLRIRVVADMDYRVRAVIQRTGLSRPKAVDFIEKVEEDRRRWVRAFYGVAWEASSQYDVILNLEQMGVENAASAMCAVAALPEFQASPASRKALEDLYLGARARVALSRHEATRDAHLKAAATGGVVSVTYLPQHSSMAQRIPEALKGLEGVREVVCTMAETSILWIGERFTPACRAFGSVTQIAEKWNAAIEIMRLIPASEPGPAPADGPQRPPAQGEGKTAAPAPADGEEAPDGNGGVKETLGELIERGRAGGARTVRGGPEAVLASVDPKVPYSLIVIGDVFLSKGHAARIRLTRELAGFLFDKLKRPVIMAEELAAQYLFGPRQLVQLVSCLLGTAVIYAAVFTHQAQALAFLQAGGKTRFLAVAATLLLVPAVAYLYGTAARLVLKLIRME